MASDKKPSMYSDHGTIGSAEELEAYGVWVKSEPQDFTASLAEAANFNADALPYEADFDTGFDNMGMGTAGFDLLEPELHIPEISVDEEGIMADAEQGTEEASTQMLMKIADELSAIRTELNTLKKEFAEIRGENAAGAGAEAEAGNTELFFNNAAEFPTEEEMGFDPGREADEAALKELDAQNEAEEIHIDFDNLGIDLDGAEAATEVEAEVEAEAPQELPPLEAAVVDDDDFEMPSFDALSFEEAPPAEPDDLEEAAGFAEELVPLEGEDEELRALRLEGAESLASPPDNADYLEEDPFALNNADLEESALELSALDETALSEETVLEEPEEPALEEVNAQPEIEASEPTVSESVVSESDVSESDVSETASSSGEESADIAFDDLSFDEAGFDLGLDDFSAEQPPAEESPAEESPVEESPAEQKADDAPVFDTGSLELPETAAEEELDIGTDEPLPDVESLDLSDAVIEEPNLSEEIVEPPLEEPVLNDISFEDDISLELDGFETESDKAEESGADLELDTQTDAQIDDLGAIDLGADLELDAPTDGQVDDLGAIDLGEDVALDTQTDAQVDDLGTIDLGEDVAPDAPTEGQVDDLGAIDLGTDLELDTQTDAQIDDLGTIDLGEDVAPDAPTDGQTDDLGAIDLGEDVALDAQTDDLGTIDLGEDIALDTQADNLGTVDLGEDVALDTQIDDLGTIDFEPETKDTGKAAGKPAAHANDIISDVDDSVIPEGFEVNAKEADPSLDDDLEAFAGELAITEDESPSDSADKLADDSGEFAAIPVGLKNELKNVLSYMDHLLESLPEEKIEEFAQSEYFDKYKKIFKELGLV